MIVREFIALLQKCNGDNLVVLAKDSEGNRFSPAVEISEDMYTPKNSWSGDLQLRALTPEREQGGATLEDVGDPEKGAVNCITIWPTN